MLFNKFNFKLKFKNNKLRPPINIYKILFFRDIEQFTNKWICCKEIIYYNRLSLNCLLDLLIKIYFKCI